jgi:hypothetical protein
MIWCLDMQNLLNTYIQDLFLLAFPRTHSSEKREAERAKIYMRIFKPRIWLSPGNDFGRYKNGHSDSILETCDTVRNIISGEIIWKLQIFIQNSWEALPKIIITEIPWWVPINTYIIDIISRIYSTLQIADISIHQSTESLSEDFRKELSVHN